MSGGGKREIAWKRGDHWTVCDRCGFTRRKSECGSEPKTGFWVCKDTCMDMPHPQQYRTPIKPDDQRVTPVKPNVFTRNPSVPAADYPELDRSELNEIGGGAIDDSGVGFLGTNEVDPTTF